MEEKLTGAARAWRRREVGCPLTHGVRTTGKGSRSNVEAWRDDTNELKEVPVALRVGRPNGCVSTTPVITLVLQGRYCVT